MSRLLIRRQKKGERGFALLETIIALGLVGIIAAGFLSGLATSTKATFIADEQATAESLVRSEIEYVKNCAYQYSVSEYPLDPTLTIPEGWVMPPPAVEPVHATDDGIQQVTVTAEHGGREILSAQLYKVDR